MSRSREYSPLLLNLLLQWEYTRRRLGANPISLHLDDSQISWQTFMAQVVEFSGDSPASGPLAIVRGDLPHQLDRLLLTVPSLSELYTRLSDFLLNVVEVDGVWLDSPDEEGKMNCHFFAAESVAEFLSAGTIPIDENYDSLRISQYFTQHDSPCAGAQQTVADERVILNGFIFVPHKGRMISVNSLEDRTADILNP